MPRKHWTLIDVAHDIWTNDLHLGPAELWPQRSGAAGAFSIRKRTLRGGLRDGLNVVEVDNGRLRFALLCDRGMGLWRAWCDGLELGWPSPVVGPVHPKFVPLDEASGIGWLSGFDELLCRCGLESNGAPEWSADGKLKHPLHGRIANRPAHFVEAAIDTDAEELIVSGVVDEARLFGNNLRLRSTVRTRIGSSRLTITDEISNAWSVPADLELLYHINLGPPWAAPGSTFAAPVATMAPRNAAAVAGLASWQTYPPGLPAAAETVLYFELAADANHKSCVLLTGADGAKGLSLEIDRRQFPYFALWKNPIPASDGYCTGLEPCLNFPNPKSFEERQGRVARVAPGETRRFEISLEVHSDAEALARVRDRIDRIQSAVEPRIFDQPRPTWSPAES
jgi:galactose mutarotase-like enzyme